MPSMAKPHPLPPPHAALRRGEGESMEEWGEVAGGEAARHLPFLTPFSPRHAGREGGRGMSGVKPYCANPNESWRPLKV